MFLNKIICIRSKQEIPEMKAHMKMNEGYSVCTFLWWVPVSKIKSHNVTA